MTATELTTIIGLVITAIGTVAFPLYLNHRKNAQTSSHAAALDSRSVAEMFKNERDRLQIRLDTMQASHEQQIAEVKRDGEMALKAAEAKWRAQHDRDQEQIAELKREIESLYQRLFRVPDPPPRLAP